MKGRPRGRLGTVGVIGLGRIGLPLAVSLCGLGVGVVGTDRVVQLRDSVSQARSAFFEPGMQKALARAVGARKLVVLETVPNVVEASHTVFVTVGTPADAEGRIDLSQVEQAAAQIASADIKSKLIVLRSTVTPGTTRRVFGSILQSKSGLVAGNDFSLAYCPERTVEGEAMKELREIPKIIGGIDKKSRERLSRFFWSLRLPVMNVSSLEVAELAKFFDNVYRDVNIGLVNEFAIISEHLGVDFWEAREAANAGPRTRLLRAGPGVGGSCLTKDPLILASAAEAAGYHAELILTARRINSKMPAHAIDSIEELMSRSSKALAGAKVAVLGLSYKPGTDDIRGSPSIDVVKGLSARGALIAVYDPLVGEEALSQLPVGVKMAGSSAEAIDGADCVAILTNHEEFRHLKVPLGRNDGSKLPVIFDSRAILQLGSYAKAGKLFARVGSLPSEQREG